MTPVFRLRTAFFNANEGMAEQSPLQCAVCGLGRQKYPVWYGYSKLSAVPYNMHEQHNL